mgnify:CR=1 FL=1
MEVTLETVEKNKQIYNENIKKIMEERAELMKQVSELRRKRETLTDEIDIAKLDFEESKLVQQINDLTAVFRGNKLTLEQLDLQQDILESKIDRETYSKGMVANRKAKADLSKEQELTYCENEVKKCEQALKLYTLIGDAKKLETWKQALEKTQKDLSFAQQVLDEESKTQTEKNDTQEQQTTAPYINEYGEIIRPDNAQKAVDTDEHSVGYTRTDEEGVITEETTQVLKDYYGKQIGNRTSVEKYDLNILGGNRTVETKGVIENEDGKYTLTEYGRADENGEVIKKQMLKDNKITGEKEELSYQKDEKGEIYSRKSNGQMTFKITKTDKGISIDEYRNGQPYATYEYDENGKAIDGMGMADIEQLDENYVENFFDSQVPYFEAENRDLSKQDMSKTADGQTLLDSAIEATEESTRTSTINEQVQNIKNRQQERTQPSKENNGIDR